MKIYRVIDDGDCVLTTVDELLALRTWYTRMQKYEQVSNYGWVDTEELK